MKPEEKLKILGASARHDISCCGGGQKELNYIPGIYQASGKNGQLIPILKTLFTNKCRNNCTYCSNRSTNDCKRVSFVPDELAKLFMEIYRKEFVQGLFLSSGIDKSSNQTMQQIIETAEILRFKHSFGGFLHLKILPGAHSSLIKRALKLATRVSINIEAPTPQRLSKIASGKNFMQEIISAMELVKTELEKTSLQVSQTTQFVVGAANETDQEIIKTMDWLRRTKGIYRTFFSALRATDNLPENYSFANLLLRQNRLYQVEFLQRLYGFNFSEIYFSNEGELPTHIDPKLNYALHNLDKFPIEINQASMHDLLRIPGIGKIIAQRILAICKQGRITDISEISKLGGSAKRAAPFILINGKKQGNPKKLILPEQLTLKI